MKKGFWVVFLLFIFSPLMAGAEVYQLEQGLKVKLPELPAPWMVTEEPPPELVAHIAEHIKEEAAEKGQFPSNEQIREAARERLGENQLFAINPESEAHLLVSFEALEEGEPAPSRRTIELSAEYAADSVVDEGWKTIDTRQAAAQIEGAQLAQSFEITYQQEGHKSHFRGVVGFARPYWFWLYATDHLQDPADKAVFEILFKEIEIQTSSD